MSTPNLGHCASCGAELVATEYKETRSWGGELVRRDVSKKECPNRCFDR